MQKEIILNQNQISILKIIDHVYSEKKRGCQTIGLSVHPMDLLFILKNDLIFKTNEGYFPSTKGQEYLKNNN